MELLDATRLIEIGDGTYRKSDGIMTAIIDIDLLMVDEQILHTERLTLPHLSDAQTVVCYGTVGRSSLLVKHPVFGKTMRELLSEL